MSDGSGGIRIREAGAADRQAVMDLLLELQGPYADSVVPADLNELRQDRDSVRAFEEYLDQVMAGLSRTHGVFVAEDWPGHLVGFIIGSIERSPWAEVTPAGIVEDWYVVEQRRGQGVGRRLYEDLESWFLSHGCRQVKSDTWVGNHLSRRVHRALGFREFNVAFRKRLPDRS